MPTFRYTAKKGPTELVEGVLEANNRTGALSQLAELGYVPVRVNEEAQERARPARRPAPVVTRRRVSTPVLTTFTRQFASLVRSQVPLLRTLQILRDQTRHPYFRHVLLSISEEVRQGHPVMILVKYRLLPGHLGSRAADDHYIVLWDVDGDDFLYNDPAFPPARGGYARLISTSNLEQATRSAIIPRQAVAFLPPKP